MEKSMTKHRPGAMFSFLYLSLVVSWMFVSVLPFLLNWITTTTTAEYL